MTSWDIAIRRRRGVSSAALPVRAGWCQLSGAFAPEHGLGQQPVGIRVLVGAMHPICTVGGRPARTAKT